MSWVNIIHLVLYHLHQTEPSVSGFFRWKEDICRVVEEHWDDLCPSRNKASSWANSVSSVLSANQAMFESGLAKMKQPGWWALKTMQPPHLPDPSAVAKRAASVEESPMKRARAPSGEEPLQPVRTTPTVVDFATMSVISEQGEATTTVMHAAEEIKRKLVERLLRVDSTILKAALTKTSPSALPAHVASVPPAVKRVEPKPPVTKVPVPVLPSSRRKEKRPKPANYVRASPHENELLEACSRILRPDADLLRFRRKLLVRKAKRMNGMPVYDIDAVIYQYLKQTDPLRPLFLPSRFPSSPVSAVPVVILADTSSVELQDIPYIRDPSLSFAAKLLGVSNVLQPYPRSFVSPYTGNRLDAFVFRDFCTRPRKMAVLLELQQRVLAQDCSGASIDFLYLRKEYLAQVNLLLRRFFWPGIDMSESLEYPDYSIIAVYKKLVIGCGLMTPEGYLTYLLIHPDWTCSHLGTLLLYLAISSAPPHRDITAHVAATNPAMFLYQRFGFKAEEYIIDFYDKYGIDGSSNVLGGSKNAFFMRLRH